MDGKNDAVTDRDADEEMLGKPIKGVISIKKTKDAECQNRCNQNSKSFHEFMTPLAVE